MASRHIYIISDLHLGGAPATQTRPDFQMCPPAARRRLARFIHHIRQAHQNDTTELVINGDFVDFLAEETIEGDTTAITARQFEAFTVDPQHAVHKFSRIITRTDHDVPPGERVFEALRAFVQQNHVLTILLGNHDIELSLPAVRRELIQVLTQGEPARVEFLYDGEAYVRDDLIVEHGNRYDGWNAIAYGVLRAQRSTDSRGEARQVSFLPPPGSRLVTEIMNPLKAYFKFIDLLKPENEALIPVLTTLDPKTIRPLRTLVRTLPLLLAKAELQPPAGGVPADALYIADDQTTATPTLQGLAPAVYGDVIDQETVRRSQELLAQAEADWPAADDEAEEGMHIADDRSGWRDRARGVIALVRQVLPFASPTYARLRTALLSYRQEMHTTFDLRQESPIYLQAASRLAAGRRTVVFGHTHLPKCIAFPEGGFYFNSGTWCPIIQLPTDLYQPGQPDAVVLPALRQFVEDLIHNRTDHWSTLRTTFVKITQAGGQTRGELLEFCEDGTIVPVTNFAGGAHHG
jgi:UDP-2,3-diacylglucosamine pyrophosphatase LpxH